MIIYTSIILGIQILGLFIAVHNDEKAIGVLISMLITLPIFGRALGLW